MTLGDARGITLAELLVVMAITMILVLLVAAGPAFLRDENISRFSREVYSDLYKARQDAIMRTMTPNSMGWGIRFTNNTSYAIFEFNDNGNFQHEGALEEANITLRNLNSTIMMQRLVGGALVDPNNDILIYDKLGIPRNSVWTVIPQETIVIRHQSDPTRGKCIAIRINNMREGVWDGINCQEQ